MFFSRSQPVSGRQSDFESLLEPALPTGTQTEAALVTIMFFADALADLGLGPWRHAIHQDISQTPVPLRRTRRHRGRPRLPTPDGIGLG